ncbi:DUF1883 domain-containing protein [Microvirga terrestris]|uniref:DUF1883 domain-containing protein n=1 Tax=Microvirga terrestris TaxID=2791024 RepID=A0ABS0HT59_9HYPH|nr:DUF1883 domain-containing protein [Microvirga terrestris]MBF9196665.1 DUF1883 domain-containing protein [Microvirga terrestris]
MQFQHWREHLNKGDVVEIDCSHRCNVKLMDDSNFNRFKRSDRHSYYGGHYDRLPARIVVPHTGTWNITLDLGGGSANIRFGMRVIPA